MGGERIGKTLCPALWNGPPGAMRDGAEHEPDRCRGGTGERHDRVRREPREQSARPFPVKVRRRKRMGASKRGQSESRKEEGVTREVERRERIGSEIVPPLDERAHEPIVRGGITSKRGARRFDGRAQHRGRTIVEWMRSRRRWQDPA